MISPIPPAAIMKTSQNMSSPKPSIPTSSSSGTKGSVVLTETRKTELLQSARRSRIQWVLDGRDRHPVPPFLESSSNPSTTNVSASGVVEELARRRESIAQLLAQIPAAQCVEEVLTFLNQLIADGEQVDLESILLTIQEEDDVDLLLEHFRQQATSSSSASSTTLLPTNSGSHANQYDVFIKKLLHGQAAGVVKAMQQFITKFTTSLRRSNSSSNGNNNSNKHQSLSSSYSKGGGQSQSQSEEEAKRHSEAIWAFLSHIFEIMRECPLFSEENPAQFEESKLCAEKFVFNKLHSFLFTANDFDDRVQNQATFQRIEALSFLSVEHLDIKSLQSIQTVRPVGSVAGSDGIEQLLARPIAYLARLQHVTCPHDALLVLRSCAQSIAQILKESRTDGKLPGADELLPVMILAIKFANPPNIHSWSKYLVRYTRPSRLVSETGYLITQFMSAVSFLDTVDANNLTISPEEFEQAMKASKLRAKEKLQKQQQQQVTASSSSSVDDGSASLTVDELAKEFEEEKRKRQQKEHISIKATMSLLTYGKP